MQACKAGALAVVGAIVSCACLAPRFDPMVVPFPATRAQPVAHIRAIQSYETALAAIADVFTRRFEFPAVTATIQFYPGQPAMERALVEIGYEAPFARAAARELRAVAAHKRILINDARLSEASWTARVGTIAHELVHCLQYDLAGGRRGTSEQWLREGFAEWIGLRVLEELQALDRGTALRYLRDELGATRLDRAPRFDDMMTFRQWVALAGRTDTAGYAQATLAVDRLIGQYGIAAILDYFRRFALREDPPGNFLAAFGQDRASFEADVDRALGLRR